MKGTIVLDASAVLAFLQGEPGQEAVLHALQTQRCVVSAANEAEIISKSLDRGLTFETITAILAELSYTAVDTAVADGQQAGLMRSLTRNAGLSLADQLCLALAHRLKAKVLTADRAWTLVAEPLALDVVLIRGDAH
ncbi:MAG: PIN domain-containing protein [Polaromonas sp.]|nr:MAG: PIN domain-containing protein [Polaromonas sp.]